MDTKKFLNILTGVILLVFCLLFFTPTTAIASDCELIFEKGQTIIAPSNADEITEFMYKDGAYSYYSIFLRIGEEKVLLESEYGFNNYDVATFRRISEIKIMKMNLDNISDYIVIIPVARSLKNCYVIDGESHEIIFSSEWQNLDRNFDIRNFKFGQGWIVEEVQFADPGANDPGTKYIYSWDASEGIFILKKKK